MRRPGVGDGTRPACRRFAAGITQPHHNPQILLVRNPTSQQPATMREIVHIQGGQCGNQIGELVCGALRRVLI